MATTDLRAQSLELPDDLEAIYDEFCRTGWSDGLPVIPPTPERVVRMVAGSGRSAQEVVAVVDPDRGVATVEKVAINAVMAGCRPEYMPVIIAALQAMGEPAFNLHGIQCTTNPVAPLVVVNGPIARQLDINSTHGLLGPGYRANATIGRAIRLLLRNVGGAFIGVDQSTHGSSAKYTACIAEREEENPWEPLHVERGYRPDQSTVTVVGVESMLNTTAVYWRAEAILIMLAKSMASAGTNIIFSSGTLMLLLNPGHAQILAQEGYTKQRVKEELFERAKVPVSRFPPEGNIPMGSWTVDGDRVLIAEKPDDILIIVGGGTEPTAQHSIYMVGFGLSKAVTKEIVP